MVHPGTGCLLDGFPEGLVGGVEFPLDALQVGTGAPDRREVLPIGKGSRPVGMMAPEAVCRLRQESSYFF